jgi:uncharacterized repeat protein (TIGR03803 family)
MGMTRVLSAALFAAFVSVAGGAASAGTQTVLYSFCADRSACVDGNLPYDGLLRDASGALYGVTIDGGANSPGGGTVFALTPVDGGWQFQTLYSFCAQTDCVDGHNPESGLIEDGQGNLYGATTNGGSGEFGIVFKLTHNAARTSWTIGTLYSFCPQSGCADGYRPTGRLTYQGAATGATYDGTSPLYGVASGGGNGQGVVFSLTPKNGGQSWSEAVVYSFCPGNDCTDGNMPSGVTLDPSGNLFVTALTGGDANFGTVIELKPSRKGWKETRLYSFCSAKKCKDGSAPSGKLLVDVSGNLIGTARAGGAHKGGAIFELSRQGKKYHESVLYSFCAVRHCGDGMEPQGGVVTDTSGDLVGLAVSGGTDLKGGTAFSLHGSLEVIYQFCGKSGCADGQFPTGLPVFDPQGDIFGVTSGGGAYDGGTVYEISP